MRRQRQTIFGAPHGNCFSTCVACVLDLDLEDVPNFCGDGLEDWWDRFEAWCVERGLFPFEYYPKSWKEWKERLPAHMVVICSGPAERGHDHSTVYLGNGTLLWDPHPSDAGLLEVVDVLVFTAIDPARFSQASA